MIVVLAAAVAVAVAHGQPAHRTAARPRHHESLLAQLPPYYAVLQGDGQLGNATHVQVRATPTGKVLATVRPPRPYTVFSQVSAAGDGHEFVLLASRWRSRKLNGIQNWFTSANKFFLLRFDPYTHVPLLTALSIPPDVFRSETGFALSLDGQKLAVAQVPAQPHQPGNPGLQPGDGRGQDVDVAGRRAGHHNGSPALGRCCPGRQTGHSRSSSGPGSARRSGC